MKPDACLSECEALATLELRSSALKIGSARLMGRVRVARPSGIGGTQVAAKDAPLLRGPGPLVTRLRCT